MGGTPKQSAAAASTALGNILGTICDPVAGLVQVPCIARNALSAANAVVCANLVMGGYDPLIPLDDELTFLNCRFSERKVIKTERVEKIVVSAVKQSLKARKPVVNEMTDFRRFMEREFTGQKFIAHCYEGEKPLLRDVLRKDEDAVVLIGPEGDFSPEEVALAAEKGFQAVSLGKSRLRTETAALVAVHLMNLTHAE